MASELDRFDPDVIVVGAGSSGCALAARLSESGARRVVLLESGPDYRASELPRIVRSLNPNENFFNPDFIWRGLTARGTTAQADMAFLRGRGVGGTSLTNAQIAIRPPPDDFEKWRAAGCTTWGWSDVLPYFKRLETDLDYGETAIHGGSGPVPVYRSPRERWGPVDRALVDAALGIRMSWREDHNSEVGGGVSPYAMNVRDGMRITSNDAYIEPARGRANLHVVGNAHVDRVLIENGRGAGVRVCIEGQWKEMRGGEVVLCAGAVHSPAILMRSGIGPAPRLAALSISVVADLPVGHNLLDHPVFFVELPFARDVHPHPPDARVTNACVQLTSGIDPAGTNDILLMAWNRAHFEASGMTGSIGIVLMEAFSRGELELRDANPLTDPRIDQRMLADESDLRRTIWGLEKVRELVHRPELERLATDAVLVGFDSAGEPTRTALDRINAMNVHEVLLHSALSVGHIAGSCRMGARDDSRTVVDEDCRVLGLEGLRVVDCSVMPEIVRVNTHLTATMLGEAMADRIGKEV